MFSKKEYEEDYERRFNGYMMRIINNTYKRYITKRKAEIAELTLNEMVYEELEAIDLLQGDCDIVIPEKYTLEEFDLIIEDERINKVLKLLTSKERSVIFLSVFEELNNREIAKRLNLHEITVGRIYKRAKEKLQNKLKRRF